MADNQSGNGQREPRHQIGLGLAGQQVADQIVDDLADRGPCGLDPPDGKRAGDDPAQPGMLGIIHVEEGLRLFGDVLQALALEGVTRPIRVRADPRIGQQGTLLGVLGHQPRRAVVPQPDPDKRGLGLQVAERGSRVKRAAHSSGHRVVRDVVGG